jgi:hypothetical protein
MTNNFLGSEKTSSLLDAVERLEAGTAIPFRALDGIK